MYDIIYVCVSGKNFKKIRNALSVILHKALSFQGKTKRSKAGLVYDFLYSM